MKKTRRPDRKIEEAMAEIRNSIPSKKYVVTLPLENPTKNGWVIYARGVSEEAVMEAARDLAKRSMESGQILPIEIGREIKVGTGEKPRKEGSISLGNQG